MTFYRIFSGHWEHPREMLSLYNVYHCGRIVSRKPFQMYSCFVVLFNYRSKIIYTCTGADPEIFQSGIEEENFERKMFVDTRINACTNKN